MSSFCTAKATHIFLSKKIQHICVSLDVNFNESLTNDIVSFEQLGPGYFRNEENIARTKMDVEWFKTWIHILWKLASKSKWFVICVF